MALTVFYLLAAVAVGAALVVVVQPRAVYSALALIVCFGALAGLFFQLGAEFIAAVQVIIYAGAIMVLFLFVIMLLDPESERFPPDRLRQVSLLALPLAALLAFLLSRVVPLLTRPETIDTGRALTEPGQTETIARFLFRQYLLPFEITSILILVAVLGAMVLAKRPES